MDDNAPSVWMPYSSACDYVRQAIGAELSPEGDHGTSALIARANDGLIAVGSSRSERRFEVPGHPPESATFDEFDGAVFLELLYASYHSLPGTSGGKQWRVGYLNHRSGDFKFEIENADPPFRISYEVWGLRFGEADVVSQFGDPSSTAIKSKRPRGRKKGSGSMSLADAPVLMEMKQIIAEGRAFSPEGAAKLVWQKAAGGGTAESKISRLAKRYRETERK